MFKAFGVVILLWYLSSLFSQTFAAADNAFSATMQTLEAAARKSEKTFAE